ncbi:MAG: hypothetical protein KDD38_00040 [Bdellovibrionales bacterium]|nr:hypothetical protein [Bdellovibrionales bacterium]
MNSLKILFALMTLFTFNIAQASKGEIVKICSFTVKFPGEASSVPTVYTIVKSDNQLIAKATQVVEKHPVNLPDEPAIITEFSVRADVSRDTPDRNLAEDLIAGTIEFLDSEEFRGEFSVGLDLNSIRQAKVYQVGQFTHMGGTVIIEARDQNGKAMGSFVTGFIPFACEN